MYSPSDLVPFKPRADVLLVGHAFAPKGEGVRSLVARLVTAGVDKAIEVFGERAWAPDGSCARGRPSSGCRSGTSAPAPATGLRAEVWSDAALGAPI